MGEERILIVDDDVQVCRLLEQTFTTWHMTATALSEPLQVPQEVRQTCYALILLDVVMPEISGLDLMADLHTRCPHTKVIIMTGYADKDLAIQALRMGAFDFLEKPVAMDLLAHAVQRALWTRRMELERRSTMEQLERNQKALEARTSQLEQLNHDLLETNTALAILTRNVERTRHQTERRIGQQLQRVILPVLEDHVASLQRHNQLERYESQLTMLRRCIEDVMSGLASSLQARTGLSFTELRVALMIQHGLTSKTIAAHLSISPETVRTHRRNIRKKLGLAGTKSKLRSYIQSFDDKLNFDPLDDTF